MYLEIILWLALLIISTRQWFNSSISVWPRCVFLLVCPLLIIHSVCRDQCLLILAIDCVSVNLSVLKQPQNEKIICSVVTCFLCFCSLGNSLEWSTSALGVKLLHKSFFVLLMVVVFVSSSSVCLTLGEGERESLQSVPQEVHIHIYYVHGAYFHEQLLRLKILAKMIIINSEKWVRTLWRVVWWR